MRRLTSCKKIFNFSISQILFHYFDIFLYKIKWINCATLPYSFMPVYIQSFLTLLQWNVLKSFYWLREICFYSKINFTTLEKWAIKSIFSEWIINNEFNLIFYFYFNQVPHDSRLYLNFFVDEFAILLWKCDWFQMNSDNSCSLLYFSWNSTYTLNIMLSYFFEALKGLFCALLNMTSKLNNISNNYV